MRLRVYRYEKNSTEINNVELTGRIIESNGNVTFGENLVPIYPFNFPAVLPFKLESATPQLIDTDDGNTDVKKNNYNINVYGDLAEQIAQDNTFYVGCRIKVKGYLISKNYYNTQEMKNIMNFCNRFKNIHGERPFLCEGPKEFLDKEQGISYKKYYIDWDKLLAAELITEIPEEELQLSGKVEYFYIEDGRAFRLEQKTNYFIIAKELEVIDDFVDINKGDINCIEITGNCKDVSIKEHDNYQSGRMCVISKTDEMTRNSYIYVSLKGKDLSRINEMSMDDKVYIKGRLKQKIKERPYVIKKGKNLIEAVQKTTTYEIDCKDIIIYKNANE